MYCMNCLGPALVTLVRESFTGLYKTLIDILRKPLESGSHLLQAALHAFSLKYSEELFDQGL